MSFGSKSSGTSAPQPTFTQKPTTEPASVSRLANSAEAKDRVTTNSDPQSALLTTSATATSDEEKRRLQDGRSMDGMY